MALKSTVYKADLQIADMDRGYYADHALTMARHPSETDERLMMRLLAFALFADERLAFARGMTEDDEPELWQRNLVGEIERWIEVGQPDPKWLKKGTHRADEVVLITYGRSANIWWAGARKDLDKLDKLKVLYVPPEQSEALAALSARGMKLQCNLQDGTAWFGNAEGDSAEIHPEVWKAPAA